MEIEKKNITKEHPDLYKKVLKGGFWVFSLRIFTAILSFVRLTVLARLLSPDDFGMLGVALLMISVLETFTNTGFGAALIQKNKDITPFLNTAWTLNVLRGAVLFAILFVAAPLSSMLPKVDPAQVELIVNIIRATAFCVLIQGFSNIGTIYFQKELQFEKKFVLGAIANIVSVCVSIAIAIIYKSVWALVIGRILSVSASCAMSYYLHPYRPKLEFKLAKAKELWGFGKWITFGRIVGFLSTDGDDIFMLLYLGPFSLAIYQMSYKLANIATKDFTEIVSTVSFPAYSRINRDLARITSAYRKTRKLSYLFSIPICVITFWLAADFVHIFLGQEWSTSILPLRILSVYGLLRSIGSTRGPVLKALNLFKGISIVQFWKLVLLSVLIYPAAKFYGVAGVCSSILIVNITGQPFGLSLTLRHLSVSSWQLTKDTFWVSFSVLPLSIALLLLRQLHRNYFTVSFKIIAALLVYGVTVFLFDYEVRRVSLRHLSKIFRSRKKIRN